MMTDLILDMNSGEFNQIYKFYLVYGSHNNFIFKRLTSPIIIYFFFDKSI